MTDATILLEPGSRASGSAFLCLPGTVVTAAHVLDGKPAENVRVRLGEGTVLPVDRVERADELDIAVLRLTAEDGRPVRAGAAGVDTRWVVTSRPKDNDPALSGRVAATRRDIVNDRGSPVSMLQLDVEQALGDFGGYSGSAVRLRDRPTTVIGVLCEQVHSRLRRGDGRRESTTVLYAVPVDTVVRRFGLAMPADTAWRFAAVRELLEAHDPDGADRALAGVPTDARDAEYWFWRAATARVRGNWPVTAAYLDEALNRDPRHAPSIAAKISQLVLTNDPVDRSAAARLADLSHGVDPDLDAWTRCLDGQRLLAPGIRSESELTRLCPLPEFDTH